MAWLEISAARSNPREVIAVQHTCHEALLQADGSTSVPEHCPFDQARQLLLRSLHGSQRLRQCIKKLERCQRHKTRNCLGFLPENAISKALDHARRAQLPPLASRLNCLS